MNYDVHVTWVKPKSSCCLNQLKYFSNFNIINSSRQLESYTGKIEVDFVTNQIQQTKQTMSNCCPMYYFANFAFSHYESKKCTL